MAKQKSDRRTTGSAATGSAPLKQHHPAQFALAATAVAVQLALGVPLFIGGYSRSAYAASCSYAHTTSSGNITSDTSIACTIPLYSTQTQAQMFYSGVLIFNSTGDDLAGLEMTVANSATIALSGTPQSATMTPNKIPGQSTVSKTGLGALYVGSRGSTNFLSSDGGGVSGGTGGALTLKNYGTVNAGDQGYGIVVYSAGGRGAPKLESSSQPAGSGGAGGNVSVLLYGNEKTYLGGFRPIQSGSKGGPAVYAASIGANAGGSGDYGPGGAGGTVAISVLGYVGAITSAVGTVIPYDKTIQMGKTYSGAGIAGISRAGTSSFNAKGYNGGTVSLYGHRYGSGEGLQISTAGASSPGIYLVSEGGIAQNGGSSKSGCDPNCAGGTGGSVTVSGSFYVGGHLNVIIRTQGNYSSGLVAQSLGGAGATGRAKNGSTASVAQGGASGAVSLFVDAYIQTSGTSAHGIVAQSLGAGGGNYTTSATYVGDQNATSAGGDSVLVQNRSSISVSGNTSYGILAQSIGGAGGNVNATNAYGTNIGGQTGGVTGSSVTVNTTGNITTGNQANGTGTGGIGILAQSIGGGGGNATSAGILSFGGNGSAGGSGSNGGTVAVNFTAYTVQTYGADAPGIQAQSIGGGGGNGRNKTGLWAATGGAGGPGGDGGNATVNLKYSTFLDAISDQSAKLYTAGDYSDGILVQSIGGGGGSGGKATAWGTDVAFARGGSGGSGGAGGGAYANLYSANPYSLFLATQGLQAQGIVVQSIGGGGGSGGASKANAIGVLTIAHAHGGTGGGGGGGGTAKASVTGGVTTYGYDSAAVVVQSIGGGGGNGAASAARAFSLDVPIPDTNVKIGAALSFATGGSGGYGGNGGTAYAVNQVSSHARTLQQAVVTSSNGVAPSVTGTNSIAKGTKLSGIVTFADGATGMLVQSIGGGGGNGGDSTALASAGVLQEKWENIKQKVGAGSDSAEESFNFALSVSHGGGGGSGGNGGAAKAINQGSVSTYGMFGDGLIVQSIGGGGGNGGTGNAKTNGAGYAVSLSHALGGYGSAGGYGGTASAGNASGASIRTSGNDSRGILVQSIGGGGGNAGGGAGTSDATFGLTLTHGHSGSNGGNGGAANAYNQGTIVTKGDWSDGILVQSIGGGGGNGGAGDSSLTVPSAQQFKSLFSPNGYYASNEGDIASAAGTNKNATKANTFTMSLGASGGTGGNGGAVVVTSYLAGYAQSTKYGNIQTSGTLSHGILAQSIGGGGGNAAVSPGNASATTNLYLGASGGSGGNGGSVQVFANDITTYGFSSHGIVAQSIGGGGGTGVASGLSGTVKTKLGTRSVNLQGTKTYGSSGNGSSVSVYNDGRLTTGKTQPHVPDNPYYAATDSFGILAQSIGGGGGMAAVAQGSSTAASGQGSANSIGISLGSEGLTGDGYGGDVSVTNNFFVQTFGNRNMGIVAQSVGGGGGLISGSASTLSAVTFNKPAQNNGYFSTNGGNVTVSLGLNSGMSTHGAGAIGILAQSVGGGGGFAADPSQAFNPVTGTTSGGSNGSGGAVTVTLAGASSLVTEGDNAHGIFAQTVGGGGGVWDNGSGTSAGSLQGPNATAQVGPIAITVGGIIAVYGANAWGIVAQSAGVVPGGSSPITVAINSGASVSGKGTGGGAVWMHSQGSNLLTNNGTLTGNVQNNNHGVTATPTPWDSVNQRLAAIDWVPQTGSRFINNGTFNSDRFVSGITLTNNGTLNVGGTGRFQTTRFDHHLVGSGRILMDVDMLGGRSDQIDVVGAITPGPSGPMQLSLNLLNLKPGVELELIRAGVMDPGAITIIDPLLYDFSLGAPGGPGGWYRLVTQPTFGNGLAGAPPNVRNVAAHLTDAWKVAARGAYDPLAGWGAGPTMNDLFNYLLGVQDPLTYQQQLSQLLANTVLGQMAASTTDAIKMAGSAMGCPNFAGPGTLLKEQTCAWASISASKANQDPEPGVRGNRRTATDLQVGGQLPLAPDWFLGANLLYQQADYRSSDGAERLDTTTTALSLALKYQVGDWYFAGSLGGGTTSGDGTRQTALGSLRYLVSASPSSSYLFARARAAYEWTAERYYVRPLLDLDLIQLRLDGYRESGAGALGLAVDSTDETVFVATPAVEVGGRIDTHGLVIRPYGSLGLSLLSTDNLSAQARLVGAPGTPGFSINQPLPSVVGRLRLGAEIYTARNLGVKLEYGLDLADGYDDQTGFLELTYRF